METVNSMLKEADEKIQIRTANSQQTKGDGRIPKNPDVPHKGYDPKSQQDELPQKGK